MFFMVSAKFEILASLHGFTPGAKVRQTWANPAPELFDTKVHLFGGLDHAVGGAKDVVSRA